MDPGMVNHVGAASVCAPASSKVQEEPRPLLQITPGERMPPTSNTDTRSSDPREDAARQASLVVDPPGDQPRLWRGEPAFDDCALVGEQLLMESWALARSRGNRVSVEAELHAGAPIKAHCGGEGSTRSRSAGDGPLPKLEGSAVLTDAFDLRARHDEVTHLEARLEAREKALEAQVRAGRGSLEGLQSSACWRVTSPLRSATRQPADTVASRLL